MRKPPTTTSAAPELAQFRALQPDPGASILIVGVASGPAVRLLARPDRRLLDDPLAIHNARYFPPDTPPTSAVLDDVSSAFLAYAKEFAMAEPFTVRGAVPYVFCADAGAVSIWCQEVLGFIERDRWSDDDGAVSNVELTLGGAEVWLDGPVPDWPQRLEGLGSWIGLQVDDLDAVHAHLRDLGVAVEPPVDRGFGTRHLTVVDPEGHQWGLIERT